MFPHQDRPTQSIVYVPLQVNRFRNSVLLIVQYKYLKSCSGYFNSPESDPLHKIMRYWLYYSICWFLHFQMTESVRWKWFVLAVYQLKIASRRGRTLIIFKWFIGAGRPWVRGPPSKNVVQILRGGSSYTRFLMREHSKRKKSHVLPKTPGAKLRVFFISGRLGRKKGKTK